MFNQLEFYWLVRTALTYTGTWLGYNEKDLVPSHPLSICPLQRIASEMRSGSRPFKSTEARQPWKPSLAWTSFGKDLYVSLATPPMYKSPVGRSKFLSQKKNVINFKHTAGWRTKLGGFLFLIWIEKHISDTTLYLKSIGTRRNFWKLLPEKTEGVGYDVTKWEEVSTWNHDANSRTEIWAQVSTNTKASWSLSDY